MARVSFKSMGPAPFDLVGLACDARVPGGNGRYSGKKGLPRKVEPVNLCALGTLVNKEP